ncbi:MAG: molybdenum cofactor biosynthesis protein MoaE [Chitinophagales bacterium]
MHKIKKVFVEGAISPEFIADAIAKHTTKTDIGAHSIFLGQVRKDRIEGKEVCAIEYSAYTEMAEEVFLEIRESAFAKYGITCMHIYHSIGLVQAGEISLFVFTSAPHRRDAIDACNEIVERIKKDVPVWGKELFADTSHQWKKNT